MAESLITQVARPDDQKPPPPRKPKLKLQPLDNVDGEEKAGATQTPGQTEDADNRQTGLGKIFSRQFTPTIPKSFFNDKDKENAGVNSPRGGNGAPNRFGAQSPKAGDKQLAVHNEDEDNEEQQKLPQAQQDTNPAAKPENPPKVSTSATAVNRQGGASVPSSIGSVRVAAPDALLGPNVSGKKMCLVLDLDETLVHSSFKPVPSSDFILSIEMDGVTHKVYVLKRPGVDEFLVKMAEIYEIVIFTASLDKYANPLLDLLDTHKVISSRLYREHCSRQGQMYIKDLSRIGRTLGHTIIIDNSPHSYALHPNYAIPILSWFDDPHDTELTDMMPFLDNLVKVDDVSSVLDASKPWRVSNKKLLKALGEQ